MRQMMATKINGYFAFVVEKKDLFITEICKSNQISRLDSHFEMYQNTVS